MPNDKEKVRIQKPRWRPRGIKESLRKPIEVYLEEYPGVSKSSLKKKNPRLLDAIILSGDERFIAGETDGGPVVRNRTSNRRAVEVNSRPRKGPQLIDDYVNKYLGMDQKTLEKFNPRYVQVVFSAGQSERLKRVIATIAAIRERFPEKMPTWKRLKNGTPEEQAWYSFLHRNRITRILEKYKPYGDPKEYYKRVHAGKTIGQVQKEDPNFVNYCRYHGLVNIMPTQEEVWEGREVEEFLRRFGSDAKIGQVVKTKEGRQAYMRVFRAGKLATLKEALHLPPPVKRKRK